ncbi:P22AR C-terminal domain-containing protein [Enterobacter hormaechei]|uniref:P22AR C-terminal domain-containing protein n=1 Tax=Enterobacter hormaechei TaxID=158836 RepID=UPI00079342A2|nr:P22AR C-terminal domain-containing protein [Enterobacter hormaechei]CZW00795.1 P22AR C-terminal domain [Enterobacter hormaechei]CZW10179.1 P22AR C-terminal domain [Enterobacter hormaechei]CZW67760.1 P22AR C-terminal domain [Enterobacter hormaechei]SAE26334.1 P22AR C-terminal domain [Enterobacter hormaechei]SAI59119.1 P22AR C-terminal domain [Enterobacter hormaechei]
MHAKNDEAQKCANTLGLLSNKSGKESIDMNSVHNNELTFQQTEFHPVSHAGETWLTSSELAAALGYKKSDAVTQIFSRYHDEFTEHMSTTLKMSVVRKTGAVDIPVRVFSLRGSHLIAMFATTPKAKEFRRWVLDVIDREVAQSPIAKQFTDDELCTLAYLWRSAAVMYEACREVHPLLLVAEHRLVPRFSSIGTNYNRGINKARAILKRETDHIKEQPWGDSDWKNVFSYGKGILQ